MSGGDGDNSAADERDSDFNGSGGSKLRVNGGSGAGARAAGDSAGARLRRLRRCKSFSRCSLLLHITTSHSCALQAPMRQNAHLSFPECYYSAAEGEKFCGTVGRTTMYFQ